MHVCAVAGTKSLSICFIDKEKRYGYETYDIEMRFGFGFGPGSEFVR